MKRNIILSILGALCLGFTLCGVACTSEPTENTNGLTFTQTDGGYAVSGVSEIVGGKAEIPDEYNGKAVVAIADSAFENQDGLQEIVIADSVQTIGKRAFASCDQLTTINFGKITAIENNAFENCSRIKEIALPDSLTTVGDEVFSGCHKLKELVFPDSVQTVGKKVASALETLKRVEIGDSVETLGEQAFYDNDALQEVVISDNAPLTIGKEAFATCGVLHTVKFGAAVAEIGESAFAKCIQLVEAEIGDSCVSIGAGAFSGCFHLTGVTLGESLAVIGSNAFGDCHTLVEVCNKSQINIVKGATSNGKVASNALNVCRTESDKKRYIGEQGIVYYKDGEDLIVVGQVKTESGLDLTFDENTTEIYLRAFYSNGNIASVTLGPKVKKVGYRAFAWCTKIKTLTMSDSVETLEGMAFYKCSFMDTVIVGVGLKTAAIDAFYRCTAINKVFYKGNDTAWSAIDFDVTRSGVDAEANSNDIKNATRYYYSKTQPSGSANYWHYDENGGIRIWG